MRANRRKSWARRLAPVLLAVALATTGSLQAGGGEADIEYKVKAGFLANFARFVQWPAAVFAEADSPYIVGILGDDPFGPSLDGLAKKELRGRGFEIRRFATVSDEGLASCHMLFVSASERKNTAAILDALDGASVLSVGDSGGFAKAGGVMNFSLKGDKVRCEINRRAAARAKLKISSKLLSLATLVDGE